MISFVETHNDSLIESSNKAFAETRDYLSAVLSKSNAENEVLKEMVLQERHQRNEMQLQMMNKINGMFDEFSKSRDVALDEIVHHSNTSRSNYIKNSDDFDESILKMHHNTRSMNDIFTNNLQIQKSTVGNSVLSGIEVYTFNFRMDNLHYRNLIKNSIESLTNQFLN